MADNGKKTPAKIGTLVYPFKKKAESGKVGVQPVGADDTRLYFQALSNASDGFYPIGANGQWHGGIHFDAQTGATLPQEEGIRCIGDGEVVAYQVESQYSSVEYSTGKALYSRGFTLVRHRLELPPAPAAKQQDQKEQNKTAPASGNTPQRPDQGPEDPSLIFYSVYLHLLDWAGYQKLDTKKPRPGYWGDEIYLVGDKAFDQDRTRNAFIPEGSGPGINLRTAENQYAGFAPRGVKLKLGEENPRKKGFFKIVEVVSGTTYPDDVTGTYVFKGSSKSKEGLTPVGAEPTKDTVHVLPKPKSIKAGELIGYLGQYERYVDTNPMTSARPRPLIQLDVFTADDIKGFIAKSRERAKQLDVKQKVLLKVDKGAKLALPTKADQQIAAQDAVVAVGTPKASSGWMQVRKGTLEIAERSTLGTFDSATNSYPGGKMPYRFVGAQDSDAITQAAYNALGKDAKAAYTRRQVLVPTGTPVWVEAGMLDSEGTASGREMHAWSQFPLKVGQGDGPTAYFVRVAAIKQLSKVVAEPDGTRWWEIDVGTADGSSRIGWVREKDHPLATLCSPWDWPGFEIVEGDTSTPEQLYARHIDATKQARADEQAALAAKAAEANGGPLFSRLCDAVDLDDDKVLTPEELRKALKQPWLADALSRLIIHHTSEWGTPAEQWDAIDKDIPESRKADWDKEKQRIQSLQWWKQISTTPALPDDAKAYAFHPVGLIGNLNDLARHPVITIEGRKIELEFLYFYNGETIDDADYAEAATTLKCEINAIKAVAATETGSSGSYFSPPNILTDGDDMVPSILFERHKFHNNSRGIYDASHSEISNKSAGGYGGYSGQYKKLLTAYELDAGAALKSASWGKFQIMGENFSSSGYANVQDFVKSISESEKNHLKAFVNFISADSVLLNSIRNKDWLAFALRYNGPKQKGYDQRMLQNYNALNGN